MPPLDGQVTVGSFEDRELMETKEIKYDSAPVLTLSAITSAFEITIVIS